MTTSTYFIPSMDCPAEESIIRSRLGKMAGVSGLAFDLFNQRLIVEHSLESDDALVATLQGIGMTPSPAAGDARKSFQPPAHRVYDEQEDVERRRAKRAQHILLGLSGMFASAAEIVGLATGSDDAWIVIVLAVLSVLLGGLPVLKKGLIAIRTFTLNINFLMTVAVVGAAAIGSWPEAAMVLFLFAVAELIEAYSLERARNAVSSLMTLTPDTASMKAPDGSWDEVDAAMVAAGSTVRVRPGERIALDGRITRGASVVDQAPITGESIPVEKAVGDLVFAGTINGNGLLEFITTGGKDETTLARIVRTVQEAQGQRAPTQRFVDSFARIYTPIVCGVALAVAAVPPLVFHAEWMAWIYRALVLLVVGCPCALVISTPVTIVTGLAAAAKHGILIKGGVYLEQGKKIKVMALDKTGTITKGKPKVTDVRALNSLSPEQILRLAASLDAGSDHPVARAVSAAWDTGKVSAIGPLFKVENFSSVPGRGVTGSIDGTTYFVGNHRFGHERGVCSPRVEVVLDELEARGQTTVVLSDSETALGVLAVADTVRETSIQALRELHALGVRTVMLSGDNPTTAEVIARSVGIDDARGNLLPEDKLKAIDDMRAKYGANAIGMVGDGVNDAPALAKASIGFAMGAAGTDTAIETADVALMRDDLRGVPRFLVLSRRTSVILAQNISFAIGAKVVFFVLAVLGVATMWMAVAADMGASVLVIGNGLRLMRSTGTHPPDQSASLDSQSKSTVVVPTDASAPLA